LNDEGEVEIMNRNFNKDIREDLLYSYFINYNLIGIRNIQVKRILGLNEYILIIHLNFLQLLKLNQKILEFLFSEKLIKRGRIPH